jgi:hypothetical protein
MDGEQTHVPNSRNKPSGNVVVITATKRRVDFGTALNRIKFGFLIESKSKLRRKPLDVVYIS